MPISEQAIDVTFNAWWKEFGGTYESIPRALERTRQQIGATMPPGYLPPPHRRRAYKCEMGNPINGEFASPTGPATQNRSNAIPLVIGDEEIRKSMISGQAERMFGTFFLSMPEEKTGSTVSSDHAENAASALKSLRKNAALGQAKALAEAKLRLTPEEEYWADPRLLEKLAQQPCMNDPAKQKELNLKVFREFYRGHEFAGIDYERLEKIKYERIRKYLEDVNYIRQNPIAAGAYGLQRQLSDKGHEHAMRVAKAANMAIGFAAKANSARGWRGQEANSRFDIQEGERKKLADDFPNNHRTSGVETGKQ